MLLYCPYPLELKPPRWWALFAHLIVVGLAIVSACASLALVDRPPPTIGISRVAETPNNFRISQFVAPPQKSSSRGRSGVYTLPLPLPPEFVLDVEIHASRRALSSIRLAGLTLETPDDRSSSEDHLISAGSAPSWHRIHVRRKADRVLLTVDDKTIPVDRDSESLTQWLTIEPAADETAVVRNLLLTW